MNGIDPGMSHAGTSFFWCFTTQFTMSDLGNPNMSPSWVVITFRTLVFASTPWTVLAKFSRTTITVAPESFSWCSTSRGV